MIATHSDNNDRTAAPAPRTAAQREASRRNGARSQGPRTPEGRARSAQNSIRHGIFRRMSPQSDPRGEDEHYRQICEELVHELQPTTFSEEAAVAHLAAKHVQLLRVVALIEHMQAPAFKHEDIEVWQIAQSLRAELSLIGDFLSRGNTPEPYYYSEEEAAQLADAVVLTAQGVLENLAEADDEDAIPEKELDEAELAELAQLRELARFIRGSRERLRDQHDLASLFRGDRRLRRGELGRLSRLLSYRRDHLHLRLSLRAGTAKRVACATEQMLDRLVDPEQLEQLERLESYRAKLERAIERQTAALRG